MSYDSEYGNRGNTLSDWVELYQEVRAKRYGRGTCRLAASHQTD